MLKIIEAYKDANRNGQWPVDVFTHFVNKVVENCFSLMHFYTPLYVNFVAEL